MIIVGYQGIGKSSLAKKSHDYIDLESGCFWVDGKRPDDWYKYYCQMAEHLSKYGYIVFVSSHKAVRDFLKNSSEKVFFIAPSIDLKDQWVDKLKLRFEQSTLSKDYKAWKNAEECFEENIKDIRSDFVGCCIDSMNYDLEEIIKFLNDQLIDNI